MSEVIQELRITQTGGQIFFAFLFGVAFTPVFERADDGQRTLYAWALFVIAVAVALLITPVALHRLNFGRRIRPQLLVATHAFATAGLAVLGLGIVLSMLLIATFVLPGQTLLWLPIGVAVVLVVCWLVVPLALRILTHRAGPDPR